MQCEMQANHNNLGNRGGPRAPLLGKVQVDHEMVFHAHSRRCATGNVEVAVWHLMITTIRNEFWGGFRLRG